MNFKMYKYQTIAWVLCKLNMHKNIICIQVSYTLMTLAYQQAGVLFIL